jgi:hypothetical protein
MQVFLSYARANEAVAAEVKMALQTEGHAVFFDRTSLTAGAGFHRPIREQLKVADKLVFLVSPASVRSGSYTLTELKLAQEKLPNPAGWVLPVMVEPTSFTEIPAYLSATTVLQPVGNVAAEVAAERSTSIFPINGTRESSRISQLAGSMTLPRRPTRISRRDAAAPCEAFCGAGFLVSLSPAP